MTLHTHTHTHGRKGTYASVCGRLVSHPGFAGPNSITNSPKSTSNPLGDVSVFHVILHRICFLNPLPNLKSQFSSSFSPTFSLYSNFSCRCFHISLCITLLPSTLPLSSLFPSFAFSYLCHSIHAFGSHISILNFFWPLSLLFRFQKHSKIEQM